MEQDFVVGLYQSVEMPAGAKFSPEDVSLLYSKVFHVPSNTSEAQTAIKKIAGGDYSGSCAGGNVVDVLLEMKNERERKEQLYWDLQVLSVGNPNNFFVMDNPVNTDPHNLTCLHQSTNPNTFIMDSGSSQSCISDTDSSQIGRLVGKKELYRSVMRLKKATRTCWARLASEGVQSILTSPWRGKRPGFKVQAWGCVSLSDVLVLVEVKYDVVTHLLYTEMLQEHHTLRVWEALAPWQQRKNREELEDLAEELLASGDILRLAELPGAFRIYRAFLGASFRYSPESRELSWSAVSLLCEINTSRQQERDTLTVLGKRQDMDSLRQLCLHIRLATLRAQREKMSHTALLAARQSWETWPRVNNPCRVEQAALWLQGEEEEQKEDLMAVSPQQNSVLHLLVLSQEQERKHLVKLVHEVSLEDLQGAACTVPPTEESNKQAALKNVCIKRLRQIHASLQTHETEAPLEQAHLHIGVQPEIQLRMEPHMSSNPVMWSQHQLEDCALILLTHLLELQEVQASALLPELVDMSVQHLHILQAKYDSELQARCYTNLLQILMPDGPPLTSGSMLSPCPNLIDNSGDGQMRTRSCSTGPEEPQNRSDGPAEALTSSSVTLQASDGTIKRDVCTGCGAAMEELPYLEITCASNSKSHTHQSIATEKGVQEEEDGSATSGQSCEKQGSLITLAWSKPPGDDTDNDVESEDVGTGQSLDSESSMHTRVQSSDLSSTADETSGESHDEECVSTGRRDVQSAGQQCNTETQSTPGDRSMADHPQKGDATTEHDLQTLTPQAALPRPLVDAAEIQPHTDDICSELSSEECVVGGVGVEVETCSTVTQSERWDLRGPDASDAQDQKYNSQINEDCELAERESMLMETEQVREPVSTLESERTMRSLVDMQKKVEQRQQRDRERQLLRVQERLSIIQNRKAEEDLLGLKHTDRLKHLTHDLPQEDRNKQKTVVRERLEQLRRELSYVMQSKRDRNTAGFKELLGPLTLHSRETEDGTD